VNDGELRDATRSLRSLHRKVRSLAAQSDAIEPGIESLQMMANEIVRAHDAADRLPTELEALDEAQGKIEALVSSAHARSIELDGVMEKSEAVNRRLLARQRTETVALRCSLRAR
jgi:ABC-type transporter Mla subunit MlaD